MVFAQNKNLALRGLRETEWTSDVTLSTVYSRKQRGLKTRREDEDEMNVEVTMKDAGANE